MQLTENFALEEFAVSKDHPEEAQMAYIDLIASKESQERLKLLCEMILQPFRNNFKKKGTDQPIKVLNGYRNQELNEKINGSTDSDHLYAIAADITTERLREKFMWAFFQLPFRQLILYPDQNFMHVSYNIPGRPYKKEALLKYKDTDFLIYEGGLI